MHARAPFVGCVAVGSLALAVRTTGAQSAAPVHPVIVEQFTPTPAGSKPMVKIAASDRLATITTDTGAFRPGRTSFSNYGAPGLCLTAGRSDAKRKRRTLGAQAADTLQYRSADTLPTSTVALARACGARFTLESTATEDLDDLFLLRLLAMDDAGAAAVAAKRMAAATTVDDRHRVIGQTLHGYLYANPARLAAAEAFAAEVDRRYANEPVTRIKANGALLTYADSSADVKLMRRAAEAMLTAWTPAVGENVAVIVGPWPYAEAVFDRKRSVYPYLIAATILEGDTAAVMSVVKRARAEIGDVALHAPGMFGPPPPDIIRAGSRDTIPGSLVWPGLRKYLTEDPPKPMQTAHWLAPNPADTVVPASGKVVLVISTAVWCSYNNQWAPECERLYPLLRRLNARYGAAGLKIVMRVPTDAYSQPREIGKVAADEELKEKWAYYHDEHQAPIVALALDSIPVHREPDPDSRLRMLNDPSGNSYAPTAVIGRDGRTLFECAPSDWFGLLLPAFVDRAMRDGVATPTTPDSGRSSTR